MKPKISGMIVVAVACLLCQGAFARLDEAAVRQFRAALLEEDARVLVKKYEGKAFIFESSNNNLVVQTIFLYGEDIERNPQGDCFVVVSRIEKGTRLPASVGWIPMDMIETARLFHEIDYSDAFSLGSRRGIDPFAVAILGPETVYHCLVFTNGEEISVERIRGQCRGVDQLFAYVGSRFSRRFGAD